MPLRFPTGDAYQDGKNWAHFEPVDYAALATLLNAFYQGTATFDAAITTFSNAMKARGKDAATRPTIVGKPV